jgi:chromosome segregation ATPase
MNFEFPSARVYRYSTPSTIVLNSTFNYSEDRAKLSILAEAFVEIKSENDSLVAEVSDLKRQLAEIKTQLEQQESRVVELQLMNEETTKRFTDATADLEIKNREVSNLIDMVARMDISNDESEKNKSFVSTCNFS